jgi:hypothetical protein
MRPVSRRRQYCEGRVDSRFVRIRGVQNASSIVTAPRATGRKRANGLFDVSTTTALFDSETPTFGVPPCRPEKRIRYLNAPAVRPRTMARWETTARITTGIIMVIPRLLTSSQGLPKGDRA